MTSTSTYTLHETAKRIGHYQWIEQRLFELMGSWVNDCDNPEGAYLLGVQSYHHQFHSELWSRQLSQLGTVVSDDPVAAPSERIEKWFEPETWSESSESERMAGLYRVLLPRLVRTYSDHMGRITEVTDGPTVRNLQLCLNDDIPDWTKGEFYVQSILTSPSLVADANSRQQQIETDVTGFGGLF